MKNKSRKQENERKLKEKAKESPENDGGKSDGKMEDNREHSRMMEKGASFCFFVVDLVNTWHRCGDVTRSRFSNAVPFRFSFGSLSVLFRFSFGSLSVLFRFPFGSPWVPFRFPFGPLSVPLRFRCGSIQENVTRRSSRLIPVNLLEMAANCGPDEKCETRTLLRKRRTTSRLSNRLDNYSR